MNIIICDDDKRTIRDISDMLSDLLLERNIEADIQTYSDSVSAYKDNRQYDLAFIDIMMPIVDGLSVAKNLKDHNPNIMVLMITHYDSYLDAAMAMNVFRYLSKPIDKDRFDRNVNTAIDIYLKFSQKLYVQTSDEYISVFTKDILYITVKDRGTLVVTANKELLSKDSLKVWKEKLKNDEFFVQTHLSFIVNVKNITTSTTELITFNTVNNKCLQVPISRRYYSSFKRSFERYIASTV